jgi:hypothetical protein
MSPIRQVKLNITKLNVAGSNSLATSIVDSRLREIIHSKAATVLAIIRKTINELDN